MRSEGKRSQKGREGRGVANPQGGKENIQVGRKGKMGDIRAGEWKGVQGRRARYGKKERGRQARKERRSGNRMERKARGETRESDCVGRVNGR